MAKRQIKITFLPGGQVKINNAGNPDAARIEKELAELAAVLNGDAQGYQVEKHVHTQGHSPAETHEHTHKH